MSEALTLTQVVSRRRRFEDILIRSEPGRVLDLEPEPKPEPETEPETEPYLHCHLPCHHHHHHSTACPPTTATTAMAFPLDKPLHSFAPFRAHSTTDQLDPPLAVHHTHTPSSASSFASSTTTNTDGGEQDTSPSSAPSLLNDTSPSLPQTPSSSANSHFRLDLHSTDFSAALQQHQLSHTHSVATNEHSISSTTSGRGVFALFLAQRSPVLKACVPCSFNRSPF